MRRRSQSNPLPASRGLDEARVAAATSALGSGERAALTSPRLERVALRPPRRPVPAFVAQRDQPRELHECFLKAGYLTLDTVSCIRDARQTVDAMVRAISSSARPASVADAEAMVHSIQRANVPSIETAVSNVGQLVAQTQRFQLLKQQGCTWGDARFHSSTRDAHELRRVLQHAKRISSFTKQTRLTGGAPVLIDALTRLSQGFKDLAQALRAAAV